MFCSTTDLWICYAFPPIPSRGSHFWFVCFICAENYLKTNILTNLMSIDWHHWHQWLAALDSVTVANVVLVFVAILLWRSSLLLMHLDWELWSSLL